MSSFGKLTSAQIEALLREQMVGRLGCHADGRTYIVPVTYAYDGTYAYGYSTDGLKLRMMRDNPLVCFQVDDIEHQAQWRSVIAQGRFEELDDDVGRAALELLSARLRITAEFSTETIESSRTFVTRRGRYGVAYRIAFFEKTGRFEQSVPRS